MQTWDRMTESVKKLGWLSYWCRPAWEHAPSYINCTQETCVVDWPQVT